MEEELIINSQSVLSLSFTDAGYIPSCIITTADIISAQQRYIRPVVGKALYEQLIAGTYSDLVDDYVAPALAEYVRCSVGLPSAPVTDNNRIRARQLLNRLSGYLEDNKGDFPEYDSSGNILKRCSLNGGFVQIR